MDKPADTLAWATDDNFAPAGKPWDNTPTKVPPTAGYTAQGHAPKSKPPCQNENYWKWLAWQWQLYFQSVIGGGMHSAAAFQSGGNCDISTFGDAAAQHARAQFTAPGGVAFSPLVYAIPGLTLASIDWRVRAPAPGGGNITLCVMRQKDDGSFAETVDAFTWSPADPAVSAWETVTRALNHAIVDGYSYYLHASADTAGCELLYAKITPG
jgi:hypothetical protein